MLSKELFESFRKLKECSGVKHLIPTLQMDVIDFLKQINFLQDSPNKE
jgi:hypothetical protein